ncbi:MAG TPA: DUF4870 domain-containing protein [Ktedonobacterales bacterium]|jgi:uncharacterized membrane protein
MAYDPNQQYQQPPQYPPPGPQNYDQSSGYPPPGYQQPVVKSMIAQQLGPSSIGIDANIAGALSYFWIIGLIFFLIEKQNKFVRFHALQGLLYGVGFAILAFILGYLPYVWVLGDLFWIAWIIGAIYAAVQAYNGKWFKLPVVGDMAYNNAMNWNPGMPGPMGGPQNTQYPPQGYPPQQPGNYPQSGPGQQPPGQWPQQ